MPTGRVIWFTEEKGFGFIELDGSEDVFVSYEGLMGGEFCGYDQGSLCEGSLVEFDVVHERTGPRAENVRVIK